MDNLPTPIAVFSGLELIYSNQKYSKIFGEINSRSSDHYNNTEILQSMIEWNKRRRSVVKLNTVDGLKDFLVSKESMCTADNELIVFQFVGYQPVQTSMRQELEEEIKEMREFVFIASHDLKEPLRTVSSYIKLFVKKYGSEVPSDMLKYISSIEKGIVRMQKMVDGLVLQTKANTWKYKQDELDLNNILTAVKFNLKQQIEETRTEIISDNLPVIRGDKIMLIHLFQNLLSNAIKFRGDKRPEIYVGKQESDSTWTISIRDNGIGIKPEYKEKIFGMFKRLHSKSKYPGSGLGLSICNRIVRNHNGRIWVESQPGNGSTFYFTFPKYEN